MTRWLASASFLLLAGSLRSALSLVHHIPRSPSISRCSSLLATSAEAPVFPDTMSAEWELDCYSRPGKPQPQPRALN